MYMPQAGVHRCTHLPVYELLLVEYEAPHVGVLLGAAGNDQLEHGAVGGDGQLRGHRQAGRGQGGMTRES